MNDNRTRPQVVAVTGASGGIGRATAVAFGARGAKVALLARGTAGLEAAADEVRAAGGQALVVEVDVADSDAVVQAVETVERELGPVDVWVNVVFTSVFAPFDEIAPDEFRRVTEVAYLGYVYATMAILPRMKQRGSGTIVQVGSALAYRGIPLQTAYCGAKHAIQGFHESLRCELLHEKSPVHVTMVQMPAVNTPQFRWVLSRLPRKPQPVPPIYEPHIAASAVVHAADHPYLARTGFDSQQTDEPSQPDRPNNLEQPADEHRDYGTRGPFADRSTDRSPQLWASQHHGVLGAIGAAGLGAVAAGLAMRRSR
jgi:NAD(P)-dependent dehydrogenase (short-subunit alcohol dehydrogenase family)